MTNLEQSALRCKTWLAESVLPLWAKTGFQSETGVFEEGLLSQDTAYEDDLIRFRVQPRQVFVFSHATELGWFNGTELVDKAMLNGFSHFKNSDGQFCFSVNKSLGIKNTSLNAYEHAFALLGYAWHFKATKSHNSKVAAEECYQWFEEVLADHENGGYHSSFPASELRSQNPHMHLFEALMTWYEVSHEQIWLDRAGKVYDLFCNKFLETNFLREFFAKDFSATHPDSVNLDPGHHYEWIWLLSHYGKLAKVEVQSQIETLLSFVQQYGHSPLGLVVDEIKDDGSSYRSTSRLWCQTEFVKARVAIYEASPTENNKQALIDAIELIFTYYIRPAQSGLWVDQVNVDGTPVSMKSPASTLYHIFLAFSEVCRIAKV